MPLYQEVTFHDRQCAGSGTAQSTSSTSFVDITGATLTTTNLSQPGTYSIMFAVSIQASSNNTTATFQALDDGIPILVRPLMIRVKDLDLSPTLVVCVDGIEANQVLQFQMKTDAGTITLQGWGLLIDGIPTSRVVI